MKVLSVKQGQWSLTCTCGGCESILQLFLTDVSEENIQGEIRYHFTCMVCANRNKVDSKLISEEARHIIMKRQ